MSRAKSGLCIVRVPAKPVVPEITKKSSIAQIAAGGTLTFDFNIDTHPIIDMMIRADQALTVQVFVRTSPTDVFSQLGGDFGPIPAAELHPKVASIINAMRLPGTQARIQVTNPAANPTTVCVIQIHARSM